MTSIQILISRQAGVLSLRHRCCLSCLQRKVKMTQSLYVYLIRHFTTHAYRTTLNAQLSNCCQQFLFSGWINRHMIVLLCWNLLVPKLLVSTMELSITQECDIHIQLSRWRITHNIVGKVEKIRFG